ncbi:MAG: malonyl-ACP O-methyltransferase BioC [Parahaliea sp.]
MPPELVVERLYASVHPHCELVLLHGWGASRECWRPLLPLLRPWANVTLLDLPGMGGPGQIDSAEALAAAVLRHSPRRAVLVGWSLGGQIATLAAARAPRQVAGLVTLASNPRFVADGDWPGTPAAQLAQMQAGYRIDPERSMARFEILQALNLSGGPRQRLALAAVRGRGLAHAGFDWLGTLDQRALLAALAQPQLHLLGGRDTVVPPAVAAALERLLSARPAARVATLGEAGHALPLQIPEAVAAELRGFLQQAGLLDAGHEGPGLGLGKSLDKGAIAASFSRAATRYDSVAELQRKVGQRLLGRLEALAGRVDTVLDLGCGTGYFQGALCQRFPGARYIGLDLATGMLDFARRTRDASACWVAGDAEQLPLAAASVDLVYSSLAIQWCQRPAALFAELARVLRPGGRCVFSTLGPATLHELRSAWAAVDSHRHVNDFPPAVALQRASREAAGHGLQLEREDICLYYDRLRELFNELKGLGAHNVDTARPAGLGGRRPLAGMMAAYEQFRRGGRLPASYEVFYGVMDKAA